MTETQHPSEMEATMDNLEMLLEAVGVARQKVRDRRRRSVPKRAPRRPEADPIDWVDDAEEGHEEELETESEQTPEHEADSVAEPADEEQSVEGEALRPGAGSAPLPPASTEVRQIMAEMATTAEHDEAVVNALHETGFESEELAENAALRQHAYRAAAEAVVDESSSTALQAQQNLALTGEAEMEEHDAAAGALDRELDSVQEEAARDGLNQQEQTELYAERIAQIQEQQWQERERQEQAQRREPRVEGQGFTSEIRLPVMTGAAALVATQGADAVEQLHDYAEQELGARVEEGELVVPVDGVGDDTDATMEGTVSAWRSVTAEDLAAAIDGTEPTNLAYLSTAAELRGPDDEVPAPGQELGQIRPTDDGLAVEAGITSTEVSAEVWDQLVHEFGEPENDAEAIFVPVSADPHADPVEAIAEAKEDLPKSLFDKHQDYEEELLARGAVEVESPQEDSYVDLVDKHRPDGSIESSVWVDEEQRPTTHPEGVPSTWYNEDGSLASFGHYDEGRPTGEWGWTDPETGSFVSDRAELGEEGVVPGTQRHRESSEEGWTTVDSGSSATESNTSLDDEGPSSEEPSPSTEPTTTSPAPGPSTSGSTTKPPLPDPSPSSHGPRMS